MCYIFPNNTHDCNYAILTVLFTVDRDVPVQGDEKDGVHQGGSGTFFSISGVREAIRGGTELIRGKITPFPDSWVVLCVFLELLDRIDTIGAGISQINITTLNLGHYWTS